MKKLRFQMFISIITPQSKMDFTVFLTTQTAFKKVFVGVSFAKASGRAIRAKSSLHGVSLWAFASIPYAINLAIALSSILIRRKGFV